MEKTTSGTGIVVGIGELTWHRYERVSDRYGSVTLYDNASPSNGGGVITLWRDTARPLAGRTGTLVATVLATRESEHIGDVARRIGPVTPTVGDEIVLGRGELFVIEQGSRDKIVEVDSRDDAYVGLRPDDGRNSDWLDPVALYRCHQQTVRLTFYPEKP